MPNRKTKQFCPNCGSEAEFYGKRVLDGKTVDVYKCNNQSCGTTQSVSTCDDNTSEKKAKAKWSMIFFDVGDFKSRDGKSYELSITSARCSNCERYSAVLQQYRPIPTRYCPHCGAEMEVNK